MTATRKLYWDDPHATAFEGVGAQMSEHAGRASLVLGSTIFYPEAGGQLGDRGTLEIDGLRFDVEDAQIDDGGVIHHLLANGMRVHVSDHALVRGEIDGGRRLDHMSQHTAQHALSRALLDVASAETVSARLGASTCTIDVDAKELTDADVARAEDLVNGVGLADVPVRALYPSSDELRAMPLRRAPKVSANVRVIEIDGFDLSPCGGTHCTRSGQFGQVRIVGIERYKGGMRVSFHAGRRALADARVKERALYALAESFTCGPLDVSAAVGKLRAELKARTDALAHARGELAELVAEGLLRATLRDLSGTTVIAIVRPRDDLGTLRTIASRLAGRADVVAICATPVANAGEAPTESAIVVERGAEADFDCAAFLRRATHALGGRGGGRAERAEGRVGGGEITAARLLDLANPK